MTQIETLWRRWLALNDVAAEIDAAPGFTGLTETHRLAFACGQELSNTQPVCIGDVLYQLRRAELVEDWPAVARAVDDIARLGGCKAVPNPWDAALAA